MKIFALLLGLLPLTAFALEATVDFTVSKKIMTVEYRLSQAVDSVAFSVEADRSSFFKKVDLNIKSDKLTLVSKHLEKLQFIDEAPVYVHENDNALIYTPFFDLTYVMVKGDVVPVDKLTFRYNGEVIHVRILDQEDTFERYLVLKNKSDIIRHTKYADLIFDTDLPRPDVMQEKIERSLTWLTEKLGSPKKRPVIFFTFADSKEAWVDGRAIIGGEAIQISMSRGLDLNSPLGQVALYHALFSHEIAHHWSLHNIEPSGNSGAWIHEGLAELIAAAMTGELFTEEMGEYVNYRAGDNVAQCEEPDEDADLIYNCGFTIFYKVISEMGDAGKVIKELIDLPLMTDQAVLEVLQKYSSEKTMGEIQEILKKIPKPSDE